jgi:L-rhamnose mutarotase
MLFGRARISGQDKTRDRRGGADAGQSRQQAMSRRKCFALDLRDDPGLIAEYEARHAPGAVWPAVIDHIRATGVEAMEIWRTGDRLVMIAQTSEDHPRPVPPPPEIARWEAAMDEYQKHLAHSAPSEKWVEMRRIFTLQGE